MVDWISEAPVVVPVKISVGIKMVGQLDYISEVALLDSAQALLVSLMFFFFDWLKTALIL